MDTIRTFVFLCGVLVVRASQELEQFDVGPENTATISGTSVSIHCQLTGSGPITWSVCETQEDCHLLAMGDTLLDPSLRDKYTVHFNEDGHSVLEIHAVSSSDAKKYSCRLLYSENIFSELLVLDGVIVCQGNYTHMHELIEDRLTLISCHVPFYGRWAPSIRCRINGTDWLSATDESTAQVAKFSLNFLPKAYMNSESIYCEAFFDFPKSWEPLSSREANNKPQIHGNSWTSLPMRVLHIPKNVTISPKKPMIQLQCSIQCQAIANPPASYIWYDVTSGNVLAHGPELAFSDSQIGLQNVRCEVSNTIAGVTYTEYLEHEVIICDMESCDEPVVRSTDSTTVVLCAVLGVLLAVCVVAIVLLVLRSMGRLPCLFGPKTSKSKPDLPPNTDGPQLVQNQAQTILRQQRTTTARQSNSTLPSPHYHYIDDCDVISNIGDAASLSSVYSVSHAPYEPIIRDMVTATPDPIRQNRTNQRALDRNSHTERPNIYDVARRPQNSETNQRTTSRGSHNLTFRDDSILNSPQVLRATLDRHSTAPSRLSISGSTNPYEIPINGFSDI